MSTRRHDGATLPSTFGVVLLVAASGCYYGNHNSTELVGNTFSPEDETAEGLDGDAPVLPTELQCETEWQWAQTFLQSNCAGCHGSDSPEDTGGDLKYVTDIGRLLTEGLIVAGDSVSSPLVQALDRNQMPPPAVEKRPHPIELERLQIFVDECTGVPLGGCQNNALISLAAQSQAMFEDLTATVRNVDRPFVRYVTFTHLHNAGYCSSEIEPYRVALTKLLNSMSTRVGLVEPVAIDEEETIYRIDLRDYGWDEPVGDARDAWAAITASSLYAFQRQDDASRDVTNLTGSAVPYLMGDALLSIAVEPPLYYALTGAPETLSALEDALGFSIAKDVAERNVARAGVLESGISQNHRVVERHDLPQGVGQSFWITYDFEDSPLLSHPLDYQADMSEVIYTLPNGLQAFLLFDGAGQRIDRAPKTIVTDFSQPTAEVLAGASCFRCHGGILPAEDRLREYALTGLDFSRPDQALIEELYLTPEEFAELVGRDTQRVVNTTAALGLDTRSAIEPVSDAYARFQLHVDLKRAAAELGIAEKDLFRSLAALPSDVLRPLGDGPIKRDIWGAWFPATVCALNLGETDHEACLDEEATTGADDGGESESTGGEDGTTGEDDTSGENGDGSSSGGEPPYDP